MAVPAQISMTNGFDIDRGSGVGLPTGLTSGSSVHCSATSILGVTQNVSLNVIICNTCNAKSGSRLTHWTVLVSVILLETPTETTDM